jgi:hypothetical protein
MKAPKALRKFSFQEFFTESDTSIFDLSCDEYLAPLLVQKDTLEFIRLHLFKIPEHERWSQGSSSLASFTSLRILSIDLMTVFGYRFRDDLTWHGLGHYLPISLEVLEFRIVVDTTRDEDWNQYTTSILSRISTESQLALPRLRIMRLLEMRLISSSSVDTKTSITMDYTQIAQIFESSGVQFSVELYGDYYISWRIAWDSRQREQSYIDESNLLREHKEIIAGLETCI